MSRTKGKSNVKKAKFSKRLARSLPIYVMMLPGLIYLFCNNYMPMFGIVIAFKKINWQKGLWASPWSGFDNFKFLFQSNDAFIMIRNTILYNVFFIILGMVCAITVAILLNEVTKKICKTIYQSIILLPYLMSWVVVSYLAFALLSNESGLFNNILQTLGMAKVSWYSESKYWPFILTFAHMWKIIGFSMIIYYSSIVGISQEYYEAARLDGASKWKQITSITLPLLKPTIITMLIMNVGRIMSSDFGLFYQLPKNQGLLYPVTQTIDTYVYNSLMKLGNVSMSAAASVLQSIVGFVLVIAANAIVRKYEKDSALF